MTSMRIASLVVVVAVLPTFAVGAEHDANGPCQAESCAVPNVTSAHSLVQRGAISSKTVATRVERHFIRKNGANHADHPHEKLWADLTDHQQELAKKVGYKQASWDYSGDPDNPDDWNPLDEMWWGCMSHGQRSILRELGYNMKSWHGQRSILREILRELGYNMKSWDFKDGGEDRSECPLHIDEKLWADLTDHQQELAKKVGYKQASWDYTGEPYNPLDEMWWGCMSHGQRSILRELGYDMKSWDLYDGGVDHSECPLHVDEKHWTDLTDHQKELAKKVGYNQKTWDHGGNPLDDMWWDSMTQSQTSTLSELGYDKKSWDGEDH